MIQGDPQRAACLSAQIDELLFHVGTREAFRLAERVERPSAAAATRARSRRAPFDNV